MLLKGAFIKKRIQSFSAAHQGRVCGMVDMLDVVDILMW
jgi:hypothetical protein